MKKKKTNIDHVLAHVLITYHGNSYQDMFLMEIPNEFLVTNELYSNYICYEAVKGKRKRKALCKISTCVLISDEFKEQEPQISEQFLQWYYGCSGKFYF